MEQIPKNIQDLEKYFDVMELDVKVDIIDIKHKRSDFSQFGIAAEEEFSIIIKANGSRKKKENNDE